MQPNSHLRCDDPVPAELLKVHGELVATAPRLLTSLVAVEADVPLDAAAPPEVGLLGLDLEVGREIRAGIGLDEPIVALVGPGDDLEGDAEVVARVLEPVGHHFAHLEGEPGAPLADGPVVLGRDGRAQQGPTALRRAAQNLLHHDRHRPLHLPVRVLRAFLARSVHPERELRGLDAVLDHLVRELEVEHVEAALRVAHLLVCKQRRVFFVSHLRN